MLGQVPFPRTRDWLAYGALCSRGSLGRLATEGDSEAQSEAARLLQHWDAAPRETWVETLLHPAVFAWLHGFQHTIPERNDWLGLKCEVDRCESLSIGPNGRLRLWKNPSETMGEILRTSGRGSRGLDCSRAAFLPPQEALAFLEPLETGLAMVAQAAPGLFEDTVNFQHGVVMVDEYATFRGASGLVHRGLAMFSPSSEWDAVVWAEELVHEGSHSLLDVISLRTPFLVGEGQFVEAYPGPFRPDPRHHYGNFHAIFVISRLCVLFRCLRETFPMLGNRLREKELEYQSRVGPSLEALLDSEELSSMGRWILGTFVLPVLNDRHSA